MPSGCTHEGLFLFGMAKVNKDRGGYAIPARPPISKLLWPGFNARESPGRLDEAACGTMGRFCRIGRARGAPAGEPGTGDVGWDDILKTNSIANNKLFNRRPRHTASLDCTSPLTVSRQKLYNKMARSWPPDHWLDYPSRNSSHTQPPVTHSFSAESPASLFI
jgi:hypothetical protein